MDTHVLIWVSADQPMRAETRRVLVSLENDVFVSVATVREMAIKVGKGLLRFPIYEYGAILARLRFQSLGITPAHAIAAGRLPRDHGDPFDRMLVAQARIEELILVTDDPMIASYDVPTLSARA